MLLDMMVKAVTDIKMAQVMVVQVLVVVQVEASSRRANLVNVDVC